MAANNIQSDPLLGLASHVPAANRVIIGASEELLTINGHASDRVCVAGERLLVQACADAVGLDGLEVAAHQDVAFLILFLPTEEVQDEHLKVRGSLVEFSVDLCVLNEQS